jgi:hypothetical protein
MANKVFTVEVWRKIGQPDLNSRMYYNHPITKLKTWGKVISIDYSYKGKIKLKIK